MSTGNRYNKEFKEEAIRRVKEESILVNKVAKDLGINPPTLRNWLNKKLKKQDTNKRKILELEAELKESKKKIADLEVTNDI